MRPAGNIPRRGKRSNPRRPPRKINNWPVMGKPQEMPQKWPAGRGRSEAKTPGNQRQRSIFHAPGRGETREVCIPKDFYECIPPNFKHFGVSFLEFDHDEGGFTRECVLDEGSEAQNRPKQVKEIHLSKTLRGAGAFEKRIFC